MTNKELKINGITIENATQYWFQKDLNEKNKFQTKMDGTVPFDRTNFTRDSTVEIYEDGTRVFQGRIRYVTRHPAGGLILRGLGEEHNQYSNNPFTQSDFGTNGVYTSTSAGTIFQDLLSSAPSWTYGTVNTGPTIDFRGSEGESIWNVLMRLRDDTAYDLEMDYTSSQVNAYDSATGLGSDLSIVLTEGIDISEPSLDEQEPEGLKVIVFGKGDGENQIRAEATDSSYVKGDPVKTITDYSIVSNTEAQNRADEVLNFSKVVRKNYDFKVKRTDLDINLGDRITLDAPSVGVDKDEVRVVSLKKGKNGDSDIFNLEVTNKEYSKKKKNTTQEIAELKRDSRDSKSFMKGNGNVAEWSQGINANSNAPLKVGFYVSPQLAQDEVGNLRVTDLTLDYDLDPFYSQAGSASFTGSDPPVNNNSGDTEPNVSGEADNTDASVAGITGLQDSDTDFEDFQFIASSGGDNTVDYNSDLSVSNDPDYTIFTVVLDTQFQSSVSSGYDITVSNLDTGTTYFSASSVNTTGGTYVIAFIVKEDLEFDDFRFDITDNTGTGNLYVLRATMQCVSQHDHGSGSFSAFHTHTEGSYVADNHGHPDGSYDVSATDLDFIDITEDVSESGSINASGIDYYLQKYNDSTGEWDDKYIVTGTGKIQDQDVDLTDGGIYPDTTGWWRVLVYTNDTSADFVKAGVKMKYHLDN